jgi:transposase
MHFEEMAGEDERDNSIVDKSGGEAMELDGMKKSEAVQVFQASRNTIYLWLAQKANTGDYQAKPPVPNTISIAAT